MRRIWGVRKGGHVMVNWRRRRDITLRSAAISTGAGGREDGGDSASGGDPGDDGDRARDAGAGVAAI